MPRLPRVSFENAFYHVYNRGLPRQVLFIDATDYQKFLQILEELRTKKKFDHEVYSYVLMPNHFHLLIQTRRASITKVMASLLTSYAMYFNKKYKRSGVLFENRYKSKLVEKDSYFLGASRYIHLNPVMAGLVERLEEYPWSSFHELFGYSPFSIIGKEEVERLVGDSGVVGQGFREFIYDGLSGMFDLEGEYGFSRDSDIVGTPEFATRTQRKYLHRKKKRK